jgi:hypothetical protein
MQQRSTNQRGATVDELTQALDPLLTLAGLTTSCLQTSCAYEVLERIDEVLCEIPRARAASAQV